MISEQILSSFSPLILIALGVLFVALEAILFSFFIFWIGLALIIVGLLSYIIPNIDGAYQIGGVAIISLLMLLFLRSQALKKFMSAKDKEHNDNFLSEPGVGVIKDGKVYFKATYWQIDSDEEFTEGERVDVLLIDGNRAKIKKDKA